MLSTLDIFSSILSLNCWARSPLEAGYCGSCREDVVKPQSVHWKAHWCTLVHTGAHYWCSVLGAQKFARAGAMICRLWGSLARSQEPLPLNFDLTMSGWQAKADLTNSADCSILDRKISHVLTFFKVKKFSRLAALQGSSSSRALVRCWRAGLPSPTGRGGTERGTDTAGAGGLLLHLGLLGLFCCFARRPIIELWRRVAVLHPLLTS